MLQLSYCSFLWYFSDSNCLPDLTHQTEAGNRRKSGRDSAMKARETGLAPGHKVEQGGPRIKGYSPWLHGLCSHHHRSTLLFILPPPHILTLRHQHLSYSFRMVNLGVEKWGNSMKYWVSITESPEGTFWPIQYFKMFWLQMLAFETKRIT